MRDGVEGLDETAQVRQNAVARIKQHSVIHDWNVPEARAPAPGDHGVLDFRSHRESASRQPAVCCPDPAPAATSATPCPMPLRAPAPYCQLRDRPGTRPFIERLHTHADGFWLPHWTALLGSLLRRRPPPGLPRAPARPETPRIAQDTGSQFLAAVRHGATLATDRLRAAMPAPEAHATPEPDP